MSHHLQLLIYPFFLVAFVLPIFVLFPGQTAGELQLFSLASIVGALFLAFVLELTRPFDRQFKMFSPQFARDSFFTFIQLPFLSILIDLLGKYSKKQQIPTLGFLWPHHLNPALQTLLILIIAELFYFSYHFLGHKSELFWRLHKYHHQYRVVYWNNSATFHIFDLFLSIFFYFLPLLIFSVGYQVQTLFITLSGVTGILIHVNFNHSTKYFNTIFNTAELHRWHHQPSSMQTNFGKVLCLWDWAFQTRFEKDNVEILKVQDESHSEK